MKRSSTWFALTLIASALLLSAGKQGSAEPSRRPIPQPNESAAFGNGEGSKQVAPIGASNGPNAVNSTEISTKEQQNTRDASTVVITIFTIVTGIATALIAWFNYQLVGVTAEMKQVTADAATAAKDSASSAEESAKVAKRALRTDRPYLLFDEPTHTGFHRPLSTEPTAITIEEAFRDIAPLYASLRIRNYGKGPAIIVSVVRRLVIASEYPPVGDFSNCIQAQLTIDAIAAGEFSRIPSDWSESYQMDGTHNYEEIVGLTKTMMFYGIVRYKDVFSELYETAFLYRFQPPERSVERATLSALGLKMTDEGLFVRGPDAFNWSK
jgi:hypothetical protein